MGSRTVGIDLAIRGSHVARILDEAGRPVGPAIHFRLCRGDLEDLVRRIHAGLSPKDNVTVVMEPTGMAWYPVAQWLARSGCCVIRVKGKRVKALRRYLAEHVKTDLSDAQLLGQLPSFGGKGLAPLYLPSATQWALKRLCKQRQRYQEDICSIRRRLLDLVRWAHPALEAALPDLGTSVSRAVLGRYFNPYRLRRLGQRRVTAFLRKHLSGNHPVHGPFAETLARKLLDAAGSTIALYAPDDVDFDLLQSEVAQEIRRWGLCRDLIAELDAKIEELYNLLHPEDHLRTLPGIGPLLAPSLLGVLGNWQRFAGQRRLRGFCGLFPRRSESGGVTKPSQKIAKDGNNQIKRSLILAADVARKIDPELGRVYYCMMVDKGKHHKQALCAVATRLVNRIGTVLRENRPYLLRDLDGRPITVAEGKAIVARDFTVPSQVRVTRCRHRAAGAA